MRYFIRSVKYLLWFSAIFIIFISIFVLVSDSMTFDKVFAPEGGMFKPNSLIQIAVLFVLFSAIYPALNFVKKEAFIGGSFKENREKIIEVFQNYDYELASEDPDFLTFKLKKPLTRFMRMYEDAVTITTDESPLILKGMRKDIYRLASALEYATRKEEE